MKLIIERSDIGAEITMGTLYRNNKPWCRTLERTQVMLPKGIHPITMKNLYFTHGNGAYRLRGPDIIVGDYRCHGLLIHSRLAYDRLLQRIRKTLHAHKPVTLEIRET